MIKRIVLALVVSVIAFTTNAESFTEGKEYVRVSNPSPDQPAVLEFFSFSCPHCYQFEYSYHINKQVSEFLFNLKNASGKDVTLTKYHANFGFLGTELSAAWAMAVVLGIEDKITNPIFEGVQTTKTIKSADDIKMVFIQAGVSEESYEANKNSFAVKGFIAKQEGAMKALGLDGVPAVFVNGTYKVNQSGFKNLDGDFGKQFVDVINYLLTLK